MKALVLGASGQVGQNLLRILGLNGIEVIGPPSSKLDVRDESAVKSYFDVVRPHVIFLTVNTSGGVDYCENQQEEAHRLNVEGTQHVANFSEKYAARLIYYSTDYIFDGTSGPYSEEDQPFPISVYGQTKWEAEKIVHSFSPRSLILRTTAVYSWDRTSRNFAMQVWENLQAGKVMRVPHDQVCNPTIAEYLAEVSVRLFQMDVEGVFNVVGKDRMSRAEFAKILAKAMALDPNLILPISSAELGQKAPRPLQGGLKTDKLKNTLGTDAIDIQESLKRFRRLWRADTHITGQSRPASSEAERCKEEILKLTQKYYSLAHASRDFTPHKTRVNYAGRVFGPEELVNLIDSSLDFWLTLGPYGEVFEKKMKTFMGCRDFVTVNSGSTANLTSVMSLMSQQLDHPLRAGDEVITPAVTFPTTLAPLVHSGLIPVFVDCEVGTYNVNPRLLEGAISNKTRAMFLPHTLGNACDMDVVCDLAERHKLYLIEDCCDALGGTFRGKNLGTFGDLSTVSFFPAHHMTMGEGGGVFVNHARYSRIVRSIRDWGRDCWCAPGESNTCGKRFGWQLGELPRGYDHKYTYSNIGYNFKPLDLQAAIGVAQVDRLPQFIELRKKNFDRLYQALMPYQEYIVLPTRDPRADPAWFGFPLTVQNGITRNELVQWLENANIDTRQIFGGNILKQPGFRNIPHRIFGTLKETDRIMENSFFIGVYPGLTEEMIDFVIEQFSRFFQKVSPSCKAFAI